MTNFSIKMPRVVYTFGNRYLHQPQSLILAVQLYTTGQTPNELLMRRYTNDVKRAFHIQTREEKLLLYWH